MPRDKFLEQVADYYLDRKSDLSKLTMVFPNRRSAMFLRKYMTERMTANSFLPQTITITDFTQQFNDSQLAKPLELSFILYDTYCNVLIKHGRESQIPDFDAFYFWCSIILNDFSEVDAYMVDANMLYANLKDIKEMRSNHLTPEQIEVAEYLWGEGAVTQDDNFWKHMPTEDSKGPAAKEFMSLWQILGELYHDFISQLDNQPVPLSYSGLQSRRACERVKDMSRESFGDRRFAFVGFNIMSTARTKLMIEMQNKGVADFFWDTASPLLTDSNGKPTQAGRHILRYNEQLAPPSDFELEDITQLPEIEIISVPGNFAQSKVISHILGQWANEWQACGNGEITDNDLVNTAIVMADESLLTPILYSVPQDIKAINITMGIPYRDTPFAALMSSIISMHLRAYKIRGEYHYYYQDIVNVLSHPHISLIASQQAVDIKDKIVREHLFSVNANELTANYPELSFLFTQIEDPNNINEIHEYFDNLIGNIRMMLMGVTHSGREYYEIKILDSYAQSVNELCEMARLHRITIKERTFMQMIEKTLAATSKDFVGMPLKGLQLMGVMDTRSLDFDNLIMLSMNEKTFPSRSISPTMIPASMRAGYGMPTNEQQEASYAYQLFRLLSRAKRVKLLYDSREQGLGSGEMSRYLLQLQHLYRNLGVDIRTVTFNESSSDSRVISIAKSDKVNSELRKFKDGVLNLSASALKTYISCPLRFYLEYVKGIRPNDDTVDYIDAGSYGTVIHQVVQDLYEKYQGQRINEHILREMQALDIEQMTLETLNDLYYKKKYTGKLEHIPGEGQITAKIIASYVRHMLQAESKVPPFVFMAAEHGGKFKWTINSRHTVNFKMSIDRVDITDVKDDPKEHTLRFIDYKTSNEKTSATDLDKLFTDCGGMFQLLVYSYAYASIFNHHGKIKPVLYRFSDMGPNGIKELTFKRKAIDTYTDVPGFYEKFEELIDHIFDEKDYPFVQCEDTQHCLMCPFKQICARYPVPLSDQ